ncbi:MAG: DUF21 domain-containing protein [Desulfobulbaceae bacterium]|nr:MAG: DUF21 domain-containing protein [Desulfobulbaceae bacterium]
MGLLIFYVSLALGVSFLCSIMEAVLLSISASYIAKTEQENPVLGKKLKHYKQDIDRPLAAILSLNTIAHTVGAAGAGAQAARIFGEAYIGVISAVLTLLILVISEIIPKTLGAAYWRQLSSVTVVLLGLTTISMWPLVKMAEMLTRLMTRKKEKTRVHRDEFIALAELGTKEGIFHKYESRVLQNLFHLRDIRTRDIMTPRTVVFALPESSIVSDVVADNPLIRFSRIPIYGKDLDDTRGFVLKGDILSAAQESPEMKLTDLSRPIVVIEGNLTLHSMFEKMMRESIHIALVIDEFGGTEGIVTMEDFIETLLGLEIVDEVDRVEDMQETARKQWQKRAKKAGLIVDETLTSKDQEQHSDTDESDH